MLIGILVGFVLGVAGTLLLVRRPTVNRPGGEAGAEAAADRVTGLATHDRLLSDLQRELDVGSEVTLYLFALDAFKDYNSAYGEVCGDALRAWMARKMRDAVESYGRAYRMRDGSFSLLEVW